MSHDYSARTPALVPNTSPRDPPPSYESLQSGYRPPQPAYGPPQPAYGPPQPGYGLPTPGYHQGQPGVVGVQPSSAVAQWMTKPEATPGCPPGLEYLTQVDQLLVHKIVDAFEALSKYETENRYQIKNSMGQQVYYVFEESDAFQRQCCGKLRGFIIHIVDNNNQEVMRVSREFKCCAGWCWCADSDCCGFEVVVEAPIGQVIGYVRQKGSFWKASCDILDADRQTVLQILGPCCVWPPNVCCTFDQEFKVYSNNGTDKIGSVSKQWTGLFNELYMHANNFYLTFVMDLDAKVKATLIGAVFLIDFMFFERRKNHNRRH